MKQLGFYIDAAKCTGCKTCVVACKDAHDLPVGMNLRKVIEYAGGGWRQDRMTGAWHQDVFAYYLSIACNHCEDPACVKVCPTKAHFKRKEDGLAVIDREKCIGCGACAAACPYGAPQLDVKAKKMLKCDVEFGPIDALRKKYGSQAVAPLPPVDKTKPALAIHAPKNARPVGDDSGTVYLH